MPHTLACGFLFFPPPSQVIEDFGLLAFHPLAIEDRQSVAALAALIDKSNGYVFAGLARPGEFGGGLGCGAVLRPGTQGPEGVPRRGWQAALVVPTHAHS